MSTFQELTQFLLHIDDHLGDLIEFLGPGAYIALFLIIFLETGAVILAVLPGDSLLVGAAALAATGDLRIWLLYVGFGAATVAGDSLNYHIGKYFGMKYGMRRKFKVIKKKDFLRAHNFFENKGRRAFLVSRFVPAARTFMPFTAGFTQAGYRRVLPFMVAGNLFWTSLYVSIGFFFGSLDFVRERFIYMVGVIFLISLIPATGYMIHRLFFRNSSKDAQA